VDDLLPGCEFSDFSGPDFIRADFDKFFKKAVHSVVVINQAVQDVFAHAGSPYKIPRASAGHAAAA
jgi:hypothetical protein